MAFFDIIKKNNSSELLTTYETNRLYQCVLTDQLINRLII